MNALATLLLSLTLVGATLALAGYVPLLASRAAATIDLQTWWWWWLSDLAALAVAIWVQPQGVWTIICAVEQGLLLAVMARAMVVRRRLQIPPWALAAAMAFVSTPWWPHAAAREAWVTAWVACEAAAALACIRTIGQVWRAPRIGRRQATAWRIWGAAAALQVPYAIRAGHNPFWLAMLGLSLIASMLILALAARPHQPATIASPLGGMGRFPPNRFQPMPSVAAASRHPAGVRRSSPADRLRRRLFHRALAHAEPPG